MEKTLKKRNIFFAKTGKDTQTKQDKLKTLQQLKQEYDTLLKEQLITYLILIKPVTVVQKNQGKKWCHKFEFRNLKDHTTLFSNLVGFVVEE